MMLIGDDVLNYRLPGRPVLARALGHPEAGDAARRLIAELGAAPGPIAVFDPLDQFAWFAAFYDVTGLPIVGRFVHKVEALDSRVDPWPTRPVTDLAGAGARTILVAAFDADRFDRVWRPFVAPGIAVQRFDRLKLAPSRLSRSGSYLDPLNFATNLVLFRAGAGRRSLVHTRDYWADYGAADASLWCCLFDHDGRELARWDERPAAGGLIRIDAEAVRRRFGLAPFCGSLFLHAQRIAGHDTVKYLLDDLDDAATQPAVTHDANNWPAEFYAGLPAPRPGERVTLYLQNCHPSAIPAGAISLRRMGGGDGAAVPDPVPGFGTAAIDIGRLLPGLAWPDQIEIAAGQHVVRPRYELTRPNGEVALAHANVERIDCRDDPSVRRLGNHFGKGYLLPIPILDPAAWRTTILPTPMSTAQSALPARVIVYDEDGHELATRSLGSLVRDHATTVDLTEVVNGHGGRPGHGELVYDFDADGPIDGWLHALIRFEDRRTGRVTDTSFGSHMFNTAMTYKSEPQSYNGPPPGLSTRLFLRIAPAPLETWFCLIYPVSRSWHEQSATKAALFDRAGALVAERDIAIPQSGSRRFQVATLFGQDLVRAGDGAYLVLRDPTCRLFGYHGTWADSGGGFAIDHMFGF